MCDDLDDLLNEVETKFCVSKKVPSEPTGMSAASEVETESRTTTKSNTSQSSDHKKTNLELNAMIDDIFDDTIPQDSLASKSVRPRNSINSASSTKAKSTGSSKCFPVFIGGTQCEKGLSSAVNRRACGTLRCTDCDFNVESFDDVCWHPKTDYLFLRNNMPDHHKLQVNLVKRKGWRAYGCQCQHKSVEELTNVQETKMKWVCGKH